ncbi:hypothetical protein FBD94_07960 [Pedobacter hiemivivus]|uniref:DUF4011 domain-containing protein n=1 Tax=Pedobacter hiemivivus TaxID=2530454 RepID=A0A4U1GE07_9SPHI|nr:AAA domain-containing protein [Pedobacter hiemivivus]TKC62148.1 hypothetical protein FBD94_07960 [Pedobacter hiemivivus]
MELTSKLLNELQRRLKVGNRRGVHLNAIPANSRYKFDLHRLSFIEKSLPVNFIEALLTEIPLKFRISWKNNVPDLNSLFEDDQSQLIRITKSFENLINQTEAIESEKGINTFGFGFPLLVRRDQIDNKLTVAPVLIWSLRVRRTKEFNTWEITRSEEDPIYINEVLINHLYSDAKVEIKQIPSEILDDGLIDKTELINLCVDLVSAVNTQTASDIKETFKTKLSNIQAIKDKKHYESLPLTSNNAFIDFAGIFSIFEVQKQNIIEDYEELLDLEGSMIDLEDLEGHGFQPLSSVETDPSQQGILNALGTTRNLLIQGPPGTGKSQSLTAVLVNALENNRKTIVVCEKRTALEVLHKALSEKGLGFHSVLIKDIVKDRRTVVDSVRDRVDDSGYRRYRYNFSKESLDQLITLTKSLTTTINAGHKKLDQKLIGSNSWTDVVGILLKELNTSSVEKLDFEGWTFSYTLAEMTELTQIVDKAQQLYKAFLPFENQSFLNQEKLVGDNPFQIEQSINNCFKSYRILKQRFDQIIDAYRLAFLAKRHEEFYVQKNRIVALIDVKKTSDNIYEAFESFKAVFYTIEANLIAQENSLVEIEIAEILKKVQEYSIDPDFLDEEKTERFFYKLVHFFGNKRKQLVENRKDLRSDFEKLSRFLTEKRYLNVFKFGHLAATNLEELARLEKHLTNVWSTKDVLIEEKFNSLNLLEPIADRDISPELEAIKKYKDQLLATIPGIKHHLEIKTAVQTFISSELNGLKDLKLKTTAEDVFDSLEIFDFEKCYSDFSERAVSEFEGINLLSANENRFKLEEGEELANLATELQLKIKEDGWISHVLSKNHHTDFIKDIDHLLDQKEDYFQHEHDPFVKECNWFSFYHNLQPHHKTLVDTLKAHQDWQKTFLISYLDSLLIRNGNSDLPTNDLSHGELNEHLKGFKKEQITYIKQYWYSKQIDASRVFEVNNPALSVENLYNKRSSNRFARLSLRQIVQYDPDLFTTFFPIILTTPDVCSNLFKGMNGYFDIVMFDEASQLRLEDNLPAILKGKQIVVAGDEHQMPPSNYFSKIFDGSIEDEEDIEDEVKVVIDKDNLLLSCESLLDFATELNFDKKHLDFHYRSRHPFLIDFSNHAFYNQRLKPLPNTFEYIPIKYVRVDGTFSEHTNEMEAEAVLSVLEHNIQRLPDGSYPTVGIATFNIAQRNLIKSKIIERQKFSKYQDFNEKIQELGLDDLNSNKGFIKNLENIQGDETDVLILSTTYGIGKDGKFAQRFGPVNHSKGYKLLNVIITRAKYKVYLCTSIPEEVFLNYQNHLVTEGANNKKAVLFAYLAYAKAVSEGDHIARKCVLEALGQNSNATRKLDNFNADLESPFEEEVYHELLKHFDEDKLITQHQFAGFRIDMVYNSRISGKPPIAIECDGAKYHSSEEAYLHDLYRQKILEQHGFVFHRIWSTNWWRNPQRELNKLLMFIKEVESGEQIFDNQELLNADFFSHNLPVNLFARADAEDEIITEGFSDEDFLTGSTEDLLVSVVVEVGSVVKVKYINADKIVTVQVGGGSKTSSTEQVIKEDSPLAVALLGAAKGDIRKIGNLDNYVEILEVV